MKQKFEWEHLPDIRHESATLRAKVIGGWVLCSIVGEKPYTQTLVFIPDPEHKWVV